MRESDRTSERKKERGREREREKERDGERKRKRKRERPYWQAVAQRVCVQHAVLCIDRNAREKEGTRQ